MYLGMALIYAGLAIGFDGPIAFALLPLVLIAIQTQVIAREERYLEAKFGDDYRRGSPLALTIPPLPPARPSDKPAPASLPRAITSNSRSPLLITLPCVSNTVMTDRKAALRRDLSRAWQ
jgi:hypothetical protein